MVGFVVQVNTQVLEGVHDLHVLVLSDPWRVSDSCLQLLRGTLDLKGLLELMEPSSGGRWSLLDRSVAQVSP